MNALFAIFLALAATPAAAHTALRAAHTHLPLQKAKLPSLMQMVPTRTRTMHVKLAGSQELDHVPCSRLAFAMQRMHSLEFQTCQNHQTRITGIGHVATLVVGSTSCASQYL